MMTGYLVLEDGTFFKGTWLGGKPRAGEVIFNTSHNGYEEIVTDPSYYGQIMVMSAPMQGNYGVDRGVWESKNVWVEGFIALEMDTNDEAWTQRLIDNEVPIIHELDTRELVIHLREKGTTLGAMVMASSDDQARELAQTLMAEHRELDKDWAHEVSCKEAWDLKGENPEGPRIAVIDFGCKENILRELRQRSQQLRIFPSRTSAQEVLDWQPDGVMLSNGPGDPADVQNGAETIRDLLGKKPLFGICMGSQLMGRALGAETFRLKFGHHGANHPVQDLRSSTIYITSQNHGYAIRESDLGEDIRITHRNLNDQTVAGIESETHNCFSVQFHPESHPGPREATELFDEFMQRVQR